MWCILRMSAGSTLLVADALRETGHDVWTPTEMQKRRIGRRREVQEISLPITPGIVFARAERLHDLLALSRSPAATYQRWNGETKRMEIRGCPHFSVFRHQGKVPMVADRSLDPLRQFERRARPRDLVPSYKAGDEVRSPALIFGGMIGVVQSSHRRHAVVRFGSLEVKVEMCDLLPLRAAA
jgi:hypothetical protein